MDWLGLKVDLVSLTGLEKDALHIYGAVGLQLLTALATRRTLGSLVPWVAVLLVEGLNEWADLYFEVWPDRSLQYAAGWHDVLNTMLMPTLLLLITRYAPRLFNAP